MAIKITVINNVDVPKNIRKMNDDALWTFAANEWHRLISPFTPIASFCPWSAVANVGVRGACDAL